MRSAVLRLSAERPRFTTGYLQNSQLGVTGKFQTQKKSGVYSHHPPLLTPLLTDASQP